VGQRLRNLLDTADLEAESQRWYHVTSLWHKVVSLMELGATNLEGGRG
jgi:hypothetical protein